ncbi:MAG: lipopolysaccharide transport periplasmic protein LptA [Gammaproteobacteria bacterium]|jgi:lipopolysaccharide export system protein LptA|nr:lipopolysaccharide transport periplasmic protein LptA [Gammaproteobacteria bacterium]MDG1233167.1 lipopolysaccharide transport periplasmic protein LptA [Pseudomonadales bacterium]MBT5153259.1 lipopolysaccharide transport periplasmic protein LptA [Gammaproteobacteria bacterium]MBT5686292.1 lipopolysaccharide transport periplasmic protein LptA [Gammaproteobacteria bacterium]MBT5726041.1 lipopolysaccharide transport periplasmic protein LptA [Gammaproteobacteria bacterium]
MKTSRSLPTHLRFALCLLTLQPTFLSALESDQEQPIRIQADAAIVDETSGSSVYKGNVIITQGTLEVTANEVEIFTADSEVIQIIAKTEKGSEVLAHYQQQINEAMDMVVADAKKITYLVQEERLHLSGDARLQQVQDVFTGQLLYYDLGRGIVNLNSSGGSDRVNMTIIPKNSSR